PYSVSAAPVPAELKPPALPALFIVFQRFPHKLFCSLILKEFLNSVLVIISQTISVHRIEITGICPAVRLRYALHTAGSPLLAGLRRDTREDSDVILKLADIRRPALSPVLF